MNNKIENYVFGKNEINNIEITDINFIELPEIVTINSLIKYFNDCELGAIVLPLYIYKAKQSRNEEDKKRIDKYFSILTNAYFSLKNKNDNLICDFTNHYKKSFENMISRIKIVGYKSNLFNFSDVVIQKYEDMGIILPQKGQFNVPEHNFSKSKPKSLQNPKDIISQEDKNEIQIDENKNENKIFILFGFFLRINNISLDFLYESLSFISFSIFLFI